MDYTHFTKEERAYINLLNKMGYSARAIGKQIDRSNSSVSRELKRGINPNTNKYDDKLSHTITKKKRIKANKTRKKINTGSELETYIFAKIRDKWSPQQIAGRLKLNLENSLDKECIGFTCVSHETIYNHIYNITDKDEKLSLLKHFRQSKGKYRRRAGTKCRAKEREAMNKKRIDTRPDIVETRQRLGDWEGDTIVGAEKSIHILTHVDRRSGYLLADKLDQATAQETQAKTIARFQTLPKLKRHTCTYDNGVQFSLHQGTEQRLDMHIYFAYPYHSWERGTNENTNGLLRQYYKKKSPFRDITQTDLDKVVKTINNRPRRRLNYLTPYEVFILELEFG